MSAPQRLEITVAVWTDKHITDPQLIAVQRAAYHEADTQGLHVISCGVGVTPITDEHRDLIRRSTANLQEG